MLEDVFVGEDENAARRGGEDVNTADGAGKVEVEDRKTQ
jgi:hypothetical protein